MTDALRPPSPTEVETGAELSDAVDVVARHFHDLVRSRTPKATGSSVATDAARETVPYEDLAGAERARLRDAAAATLATLAGMGFRPRGEPRPAGADGRDQAGTATARLRAVLEQAGGGADLGSLLSLWRGQDPETWAGDPDVSTWLGERLLRFGAPLVAYDVAAEALKRQPQHVRLRQLLALSLARSGASGEANTVLRSLYEEGARDEETIGLLARTHKDLAADSRDPSIKQSHLRLAYFYYLEAYRSTGGYWTGINAATLAMVLGDRDEAVALATEVGRQCRHLVDQATGEADLYWALATLGEVALLLDDLQEAQAWYARAGHAGKGRYADLNASRSNARFLVHHLGLAHAGIEKFFAIPSVVAFVGLEVDRPGASRRRFPPEVEHDVRDALQARLSAWNAGLGFSGATCGSELLFLELMLERGGEAHVVLPYGLAEFRQGRVERFAGGAWTNRFGRLLDTATEVVVASTERLKGGHVSEDYAHLMLHGLASIRSLQLGAELKALAVWDGAEDDEQYGPARLVAHWERVGQAVEVIDLGDLLRHRPAIVVEAGTSLEVVTTPNESVHGFAPEIRALLFADAVGYSKLTEEEVPLFVRHFLGLVGGLVATAPAPPVLTNTWGDGLFFVFADVRSAGLFALELTERISRTDWVRLGLRGLNLRIGLHAGPVYACVDPVTGRPNYIGAQVSRAARIEPITPPGRVYASQNFAALAAAEGVAGFRCDYVGQTGLAKGFGTYPTFVVRRTRE